jgi:hypothetical protein
VFEEASSYKARSRSAKAPIKPIAIGSNFLRQAFDSKKLGSSEAIASLIA